MDINRLIHSNNPLLKIAFRVYKAIKSELLNSNEIGNNIKFPHWLEGIILHGNTTVEDNVTIFHQVTCGRGDIYNIVDDAPESKFEGVSEGCVLCIGCKVICNGGTE